MSQRQKAFLENLPKCNNLINKAGVMSGYSESYANSKLYQKVRQGKIPGIIPMEKVKEKYLRKIKKLQKKMFKDKDNTNLMRSIEIEGKVEGLFKEAATSSNQSTIIIDRQGLTNVIDNPINNPLTRQDKIIDKGNNIKEVDAISNPNDTPTPPSGDGVDVSTHS